MYICITSFICTYLYIVYVCILANSPNSNWRPFQVKINYSKVTIDGRQQQFNANVPLI